MKQLSIFQNIAQVDTFILDLFISSISLIQCISSSQRLYFGDVDSEHFSPLGQLLMFLFPGVSALVFSLEKELSF